MGRDGAIAVGLLALCAILWGQLGAVPANPLVPIGPTFYPRILLGATAALSLALLVADLTQRRRGRPAAALPAGGWSAYGPAAVGFGLSVVYAAVLPGLGYLAATTLFVGGLFWGLGAPTLRRLPGALLLGAGTAGGTYLIFQHYLHVFLPQAGWLR